MSETLQLLKRTVTPGVAPANLLLPGQLAVSVTEPVKLWVGVDVAVDPLQYKTLVDTSAVLITDPVGVGTWGRLETGSWARSVATAGDTMFGPLTVTNTITANDASISGPGIEYQVTGNSTDKIAFGWDDTTSELFLWINGISIGKLYPGGTSIPEPVGTGIFGRTATATWAPAQTAVTIADTPPTTPVHGDFWWSSNNGNLYVWYVDVDSGQWVEANNSAQKTTLSHNLLDTMNAYFGAAQKKLQEKVQPLQEKIGELEMKLQRISIQMQLLLDAYDAREQS